MPKGQKLPLPARVTVRIGRPLEARKEESSREFAARVEGAVRALAAGSEDAGVVGTWIDRWRATAGRDRS
jgi:hypothetical protein